MIDTHRLHVLCVVAEEGSFTAAAHRLNFTQSAISQQVAILERELGTTLVERRPRGVELTPAGNLVVTRAKAVMRELSSLEQEVHRLGEGPSRVRLGVFSTAGAQVAPLVVQHYRDTQAGAELVLHDVQPDKVAQRLTDGEIDAGLTWDYDFAPRPDPGMHRVPVHIDPLYLVLPRGHPAAQADVVRLQDLAEEPWVARTHGPPYADALETMCRICGFEPDVVFRADDYQSLQGLVAAGVGVGVAPRLALLTRRADVEVVPFTDPGFTRRVDAVVLPESRRDPVVRHLLDVLTRAADQLAVDETEQVAAAAPTAGPIPVSTSIRPKTA